MTKQQMEGAAREAIVKADLLRKGFEVFQTVCTNSTFDLVAYKHGVLLRVECKGEAKAPHSNMPIACTSARNRDCRRFDIFAAVDSNTVRYIRSVLHTLNIASKELVGEEKQSQHMRKDLITRRDRMEGKC